MKKIALALCAFALSGVAGLPGAPAASNQPSYCVQGRPCPPPCATGMNRHPICPN